MELQPLPHDHIRTRFQFNRKRSKLLFSLLFDEGFDCRPIPLRHPIRFYEGHLTAFNANVLWEAGMLSRRPAPELGELFSRGIDPEGVAEAEGAAVTNWPPRDAVAAYCDEVDALMEAALSSGAWCDRLLTCIEHEEMHQETLIYLIHRLPAALKRPPPDYAPPDFSSASTRPSTWVEVEAGSVQLGARVGEYPFGWDNEFPATRVRVDGFRMQSHKVSHADFAEFVAAGGYNQARWWSERGWAEIRAGDIRHPPFWFFREGRWMYRGLFEDHPLPSSWPVLVSCHEAEAYARWLGARLPTEAEFHRAAYCERDGLGGQGLMPRAGNADFCNWEFMPVDREDAPVNGWGLTEMVGNGWEWTSTPFAGFPEFTPMPHYPGYSADFFDGKHYVLKGASPVTPLPLLRPSFRNWFRAGYPYAYTTFRCVEEL